MFAVILPMVFVILVLIGSVLPSHATTITVSNYLDYVVDDGFCSLREAIAAANTDTASGSATGECPAGSGSDTIIIPGTAISLSSQLVISSPIVLDGLGGALITGNGIAGVFLVNAGPFTLRGLTLEFGGRGGGISVLAGTVEISDVRITDNKWTAGSGGGGGGVLFVASGATVTVRRTTIDQNQAVGASNGVAGGIANQGTLFVQESLVAGNSSNQTGGIWNGPGAILHLRNTTLSGNESNSDDAGAGGLVNIGSAFLNNVTITENKGRGNNLGSFRGGGLQSSSGATTFVMNSIIANNNGRGGPNDCAGTLTSTSVYNLIRDTTGCELPSSKITFKLNHDPKLGLLASNGGPTKTHALSAGSPAIDGGSDMPVAFVDHSSIDQRGYTRGGHGCRDIGAYEFGSTSNPISNPRSCPPAPPSGLTVK